MVVVALLSVDLVESVDLVSVDLVVNCNHLILEMQFLSQFADPYQEVLLLTTIQLTTRSTNIRSTDSTRSTDKRATATIYM